MTKPTRTKPVTAITAFFPIDVLQSPITRPNEEIATEDAAMFWVLRSHDDADSCHLGQQEEEATPPRLHGEERANTAPRRVQTPRSLMLFRRPIVFLRPSLTCPLSSASVPCAASFHRAVSSWPRCHP